MHKWFEIAANKNHTLVKKRGDFSLPRSETLFFFLKKNQDGTKKLYYLLFIYKITFSLHVLKAELLIYLDLYSFNSSNILQLQQPKESSSVVLMALIFSGSNFSQCLYMYWKKWHCCSRQAVQLHPGHLTMCCRLWEHSCMKTWAEMLYGCLRFLTTG